MPLKTYGTGAVALTPTAWASRDETIDDDEYFLNISETLYQQKTGAGISRLIRSELAAKGCVPKYYFAGDALPSVVDGDFSEVIANTGVVDLQATYAVSSFVAATSSHSITVNGTAYPVTAGATQEATLNLLKTDIEAGEAGSALTVSGTGGSAVGLLTGVAAHAATTNVTQTLPYIVLAHPAVNDDAYLLWAAHGVAAETNVYVRFQLVYTYIAASGVAKYPGLVWWDNARKLSVYWSNAASKLDLETTAPAMRTTVAVTTERLVEFAVINGTETDAIQVWIDGDPVVDMVDVTASFEASAAAQLLIGVAGSADTGRGTCRIKELLVCHA